jgi:hypothetical protein
MDSPLPASRAAASNHYFALRAQRGHYQRGTRMPICPCVRSSPDRQQYRAIPRSTADRRGGRAPLLATRILGGRQATRSPMHADRTDPRRGNHLRGTTRLRGRAGRRFLRSPACSVRETRRSRGAQLVYRIRPPVRSSLDECRYQRRRSSQTLAEAKRGRWIVAHCTDKSRGAGATLSMR